MGLESATYIHQLNSSNPPSTDQVQQADDHLRLIKATLKATFPNITGIVSSSQAQLNGSLVPIGLISAWFGSSDSVPAGWAICNGQTVARSDGLGNITTPNLVDRVIVGAGTIAAQGALAGAVSLNTSSGGAHTHTVSSSGAHGHSIFIGSTVLSASHLPPHSHYVAMSGSSGSDASGQPNNPITTNRGLGGNSDYILVGSSGTANVGLSSSVGSGAAHDHPGSTTGADGNHTHTTDSSGSHTHPFSPIQPSYGLHHIMKV